MCKSKDCALRSQLTPSDIVTKCFLKYEELNKLRQSIKGQGDVFKSLVLLTVL